MVMVMAANGAPPQVLSKTANGLAGRLALVDLWWGVLHGYIFRLNKRMLEQVLQFRIRHGLVDIDIALHIRLTDKLTDAASRQVRADMRG